MVPVGKGDDGFFRSPNPMLSPCLTDVEGVFVAGNAAGPKDIPDSIVEAGAAAMEAANYLRAAGGEPVPLLAEKESDIHA